MNLIKVKADSKTASVAGAIAGFMRSQGEVEIQAIGAGAVNQAVKALALARKYLEEENTFIAFVPQFVSVEINEAERTAIRFDVLKVDAPTAAAE
ncbi:MAG TPA: stage V sporulation protein S [Bellilinea sp.]|nr:stage V sporulation protein S [Bellilinea sp.]